ncbi:MAG: hypothetical protein HY040_29190 [Planctomycetes bacterium]|nr:hypothetical protein [Planctomycetota bacterium]
MGDHPLEGEILRVGIALKRLGIDGQEIRFLRAAATILGASRLAVYMAVFDFTHETKSSRNDHGSVLACEQFRCRNWSWGAVRHLLTLSKSGERRKHVLNPRRCYKECPAYTKGTTFSLLSDFSEETAAIIGAEVQKLLRKADEQAFRLLESHRPQLDLLVESLLQKEELHKEEIEQLLGVKPERDNGVLETEPPVPSFAPTAIQAAT